MIKNIHKTSYNITASHLTILSLYLQVFINLYLSIKMEEAILQDCGGVLEVVKTNAALMKCVRKLEGRAVINIGISYGWVKALLSRMIFDEKYIEITMVEVEKNHQGHGEFKKFITDMTQVCKILNKELIIGAVTSNKLVKICEKQGWKRFAIEPTSYIVWNID